MTNVFFGDKPFYFIFIDKPIDFNGINVINNTVLSTFEVTTNHAILRYIMHNISLSKPKANRILKNQYRGIKCCTECSVP